MPFDTTHTAEYIEVDGLRLRVVSSGDPAGDPLLLIAGIGANIEMWEPLIGCLGAVRTIAFDAPGTGRSDTPVVPLRMRGFARVVRGLLDRLDVPVADVLGYSFGGAVAQQLAHDAPDRVRRLILASTTAGVASAPGSLRALPHMITPLRYYSPAYLRRITPLIAGGRTMRDAERLDEHASARATAPPTFWGYQSQLMAITGWTSALWLHQLRQPTLVLSGDEDPLVPLANARFLAQAIPRARLHVIPGGGHLVLLDQPQDAAAAISTFLATP